MEPEKFKYQLRKTCMEYLVLQVIKQKPTYAPDIIAELKRAHIIVVEGTVYPLLARLKNNGVLSYTWQESTQGPPRKYYTLTEEGIDYLENMENEFRTLRKVVKILNSKQED